MDIIAFLFMLCILFLQNIQFIILLRIISALENCMLMIIFVGFLVFLYCLYFIKNPHFTLNKIKIKRSRYLLISELSMGGIIFFYTLFSGYSKIFEFLLRLGMVIMCFLEMWLRIPAIKEDSNLSSEIKIMLMKKAKRDFYSVLPIFFMMMCMVVFVYFRN